MKGIVFNILSEMVEEQLGLAAWDQLLTDTGLDGLYIASETYPDEELVTLVGAAEKATGTPANEIIFAFGEYMMPHFYKGYPMFFEHDDVLEFLLTVDQVIHVEVRKLYPEAALPSFEYSKSDQSITMQYRSPRKFCALAEGLIQGAATHFKQPLNIAHDTCMHTGSDHCLLQVTKIQA